MATFDRDLYESTTYSAWCRTPGRQALKKLGWATKYSPHGTRTTGSTRLNEMGYRPDAIEAQLAHAEPNNVRRTYNNATYLDERRAMMQAWAGKLDEWKTVAQTKLD